MRGARGQALVEWVLLLPMLLVLLVWGIVLTELVRAKLKLLEAARLGAWEMATFSQTDYGPAGSSGGAVMEAARAAEVARAQAWTASELKRLYARLDALDARTHFSPFLPVLPLRAELEDTATRWEAAAVRAIPSRLAFDLRPYAAVAGKDVSAVLTTWGFGLAGVTRASASAKLGTPLFEQVTGVAGGSLQASFTLLTDDWHSPDGLDANMVPGRAGKHTSSNGPGEDSLLYRQARRMTFLGVAGDPMGPLNARGWSLFSRAVGFPKLAFQGTFVVSHGYRDNASWAGTRGCDGAGHDVKHPAFSGLNNLHPTRGGEDYGPGAERLRLSSRAELKCFDTSPFRDTQSYEGTGKEDGSLPLLMFAHRGNHFMGCKHAMAEDVSHAVDGLLTDEATDRVDCE